MRGKKKSDRAEQLVLAAQRLFHRRGAAAVSLRDVAAAARVPPGGVFYHFPTKGALLQAAAERRRSAMQDALDRLEAAHPDDPRARIDALCAMLAEPAAATARHGCPHARLIADLSAARGGGEADARAIAAAALAAVEAFVARAVGQATGSADTARRAGERFVILWQGAGAVSLARGDPDALRRALAEAADLLPRPATPSPRKRAGAQTRKNRPNEGSGG